MKYITILLLTLSLNGLAQDKYRALTLGTTNHVNKSFQFINQVNYNLSYELNNNYFISSWSGLNFNHNTQSSWLVSNTTIDKQINDITIGLGVLYTDWRKQTNQFEAPTKDNIFFTVKFEYKIKL